MIDVKFWQSVAEYWKKDDDGIDIPEINTGGIELIDPSDFLDTVTDDEIDDILDALGFDDF